jgi:hypothetical protein
MAIQRPARIVMPEADEANLWRYAEVDAAAIR